ncbi:T-box transcription factor TBX20-like, partial [Mizuhopecten yessoensis]|uniref:T-box transcription factor TBX20-like n=1 Tax=Mizuhopecten yessoensis TaxID=6573 RepID=UPI000B45F740
MDSFSDDNSCVDGYPGDRRAVSPSKALLSSKATAFSIAALMGREEEEEDNRPLTPTDTSPEDRPEDRPEDCGETQIAPLEKLVETATSVSPVPKYTPTPSVEEKIKSEPSTDTDEVSTTTTSPACSKEMAGIQCCLETKDLWDKFHELGTEMIITKTGR